MIRQTEVDGVPALVSPNSGPTVAGLSFRVGRADETLSRTGITHLVEHLALHRHGLTDYHYNGATGTVETTFVMQGSESDIVTFLDHVCDSLADLPLDRLEVEKSILRTEEAGTASGVNASMPLWRYGAATYGLVSYPEWGLHAVTPDEVRHWAQTWFTRANAVLWIAGDRIPPGLRLRLRDGGTRRPVPTPTSALPDTPAYFVEGNGVVVFDGVMPRKPAGQLLATVLERELFRSLRQEGGFSYTASTSVSHRGDGLTVLTAYADALPEKQDAVVGGFIDVLAKLRAGRIEQADIQAARTMVEEALRHPDIDAIRLPSLTLELLTGRPIRELDELREQLLAVVPEDIHTAVREVTGTGLLRVPVGHPVDWAGYVAAPTSSTSAVAGVQHASLADDPVNLTIGPEGVSVTTPTEAVTVRYRDCVASLAFPDGARHLVGRDAITVRVEPTLYRLGPGAIQAIDTAVPPMATVVMPARDPEVIPQPSKAQADPAPRPGRFGLVGMILLFTAGSMGCCFAGLLTWATTLPLAPDEPEFRDTAWYVGLAIFWAITLAMLVPASRMLWRRLRAGS